MNNIKIKTIGQLLDYVETVEKAEELIDYINNLQEKLDFMIDRNDEKQERIDKAMEHLKIKQARLINEKDYVITDLDLDEIMQDLEKSLQPCELNCEVEEEKKIPEKLEYYDDSIAWVIDDVGQLSDVDKVIIDKLNEVLDYLKSKGE